MSSEMMLTDEVNAALSSPLPRPDLPRFQAVADLLRSRASLAADISALLKTKLGKDNSPKTRLLTLELMEYLACQNPPGFLAEISRKSFLQHINGLLADAALDPFVKLKGLSLIQFFKHHFAAQAAEFPNFQWYHQTLVAKGIKLPPYQPSPYVGVGRSSVGGSVIGAFTPQQRKLFGDLNVVLENVAVANSMIDEGEGVACQEVLFNLKVMEKKLLTLPDKLTQAREDYLYRLALAIIQDIGFTIDRHYRLSSKLTVPNFESKAQKVIREGQQVSAPRFPEPTLLGQEGFAANNSLFSKDGESPRAPQAELLDLTSNAPLATPPQSQFGAPTSRPFNDNIYALDLGMMKPVQPVPGFNPPSSATNFSGGSFGAPAQFNDLYLNPAVVQHTSFVKPPGEAAPQNLGNGQGLQFHNPSAELLKNPPKAPEYDPFSDIEPNKVLPQHIVDPKAYDTSKMGDIDFI